MKKEHLRLYKMLHKALWAWRSGNPKKRKEDWPGWDWNGGPIPEMENNCFLCHALDFNCLKCPIANLDRGDCGIWEDFMEAKSKHQWKKASRIAKQIAEAWDKEE